MAGTYTKKDFGAGPEEQTLLKDANGVRILPPKGSEPVRLSPGWEGTGRPDDELNFKDMSMDQINLELNPPKDKYKAVYIIMILHGIGTLISWNMFITAQEYFKDYKLKDPTNSTQQFENQMFPFTYSDIYTRNSALAAQIPNLIFNWLNLFVQLGGNLTTRIVWGIFVQVLIFVVTIILAMYDTSSWIEGFFWTTIVTIIITNIANGIYQNSVYGMAAKLPGKYTGAIVLGSNISGTFVAFISLLSKIFSPNVRTAAIYYFITALFILLACFDTYFALPINRFYRYHELQAQKAVNKQRVEQSSRGKSQKIPFWKVFKQCWIQCFNVFFIFFITLSIYPDMHLNVKRSDPNFIVPETFYTEIMCFIVFNVSAMLGSTLGTIVQWPSKKNLIIFVLLRVLYIPIFLVCNYSTNTTRTIPVLIQNDWIYLIIAISMGLTSGYFSSLAMMYCPSTVEPQYAAIGGMFGAAFLITGICTGLLFANLMPVIVSHPIFGGNATMIN